MALTSLNEGTPLTLIEAMSCGRCVVATKVGGVVDILGTCSKEYQDFSIYEHGLGVESRNVQGFAEALQYLIEQTEIRQEMGERGQAFVKAGLSKARLISDIEGLYRELLGVAPITEKVAVRTKV